MKISKKTKEMSSVVWKLLVVVIGVVSLIVNIREVHNVAALFYFFTILTNVTCILTFLILALNRNCKWEAFRGGITTCILLVMLAFHFILVPTSEFYNTQIEFYNYAYHYVIPIMATIDFFLFAEHNKIKWYHPICWTGALAVYLIFIFIRAAIGEPFQTGYGLSKYPYFFLDVETLGAGTVAFWIVILLMSLLALGYIIMGLDRLCGKLSKA